MPREHRFRMEVWPPFSLACVRQTPGGSTRHTAATAKTKPMRDLSVVPPIGSREVVWVQRSGVRHTENTFQPLDLGNGLLGVHAS